MLEWKKIFRWVGSAPTSLRTLLTKSEYFSIGRLLSGRVELAPNYPFSSQKPISYAFLQPHFFSTQLVSSSTRFHLLYCFNHLLIYPLLRRSPLLNHHHSEVVVCSCHTSHVAFSTCGEIVPHFSKQCPTHPPIAKKGYTNMPSSIKFMSARNMNTRVKKKCE